MQESCDRSGEALRESRSQSRRGSAADRRCLDARCVPCRLRVSLARVLDDAAKTLGRAVTDKDVEPVTWVIAQAGRAITSVAYSRAIATMHQVGLAMARFQQSYDRSEERRVGKECRSRWWRS